MESQFEKRDWETMKKEEIETKLNLQREYCKEKGVPCLVETNTPCARCGVEILFYYREREARGMHLTKCKICSLSLLD